jgi:subtilisin family serine protease
MLNNRIKTWMPALCLATLGACGGGDEGSPSIIFSNPIAFATTYFPWMNAEIQNAWAAGFFGQGARIVVVDDFQSADTAPANLGLGTSSETHGTWVAQHVEMLSPGADLDRHDFTNSAAITLTAGKLSIVNLSYGMPDSLGPNAQIAWGPREASALSHANGAAIVVKSAGNNSVAVGQAYQNKYDYLSRDLIGKPTAIFVGALSSHGTPSDPALLAPYSNYAGADQQVQEMFLVVGVTGGSLGSGGTNLYGTSFAAPQVAGYAAILGSKFPTATPLQITDQLLDTARTDTILGYDIATHGQGEASLSRALAPQSIN